jgi:hypothetical protein
MIPVNFSVKVVFMAETHPDWISRAIMWAENAPYSHVAIMYEDVDGKEKIHHAVTAGIGTDDPKEYLKHHKIVKAYEVPMRISKEIFSGWVQGRGGRDYAESQFINIMLAKIGIKWVPFKNGAAETVCSEEVASAVQFADLDVPADQIIFNVDLITPAAVDKFLSTQSKVKLLKL